MIYVLSGGQTGATLTVTSSGAGTITVSNTTLGKSYSKSVTAGGSVVFKGLKTGTWTIKLTDGSTTSTKTITITSDYSTNIAYFSASISITYPANSTCIVTNSAGQTVASDANTGTSSKTWTATVNATGTYTITATATDGSGDSASDTVEITTEGQSVSIELTYTLYLFRNGAVNESYGGFEVYQTGGGTGSKSISYSNNLMVCSGSYSSGAGACAYVYINKNKIDLTDKQTLRYTFESITAGQTGNFDTPCIFVDEDYTTITQGTAPSHYKVVQAQTTSQVATLDISSLTGEYYIGLFYLVGGTINNGVAKISEIEVI